MTVLAYPAARLGSEPTSSLQVTASLAVPWRTLQADAKAVRGEVIAYAGYHLPGVWEVFKGEPDTPRARWTEQGRLTARGLPKLRKKVKPQFFQDADLETVLNWIGGQVAQPLKLTVTGGTRRHYSVTEGSAWSAVKAALLSWRRTDYVAVELDDYSLYLGPEAQSPFATAGIQATFEHMANIYEFDAGRTGARIVSPAYPWLRVGHRVRLSHPTLSGTARIVEVLHEISQRDTETKVEVLLL